jgi:hypothetical protein
MKDIIPALESIISYYKEKKVLLVYFTSNIWSKLLNKYNIPDDINIKNCYELRKIFFEYNDLINELYRKEKNSEIKKDINNYFEKDEFAFLLDKNIKTLLNINKKNKKLLNSENLGLVEAFNPYYKEDKYIYKRDSSIFDYIDFDDNNEQFIKTFKKLQFEKIFKDNIIEFLKKMISKIKNISNFGTVIELIDIKKISKINDFYYLLKDKYEYYIKGQIESLNGEKLNEAVKILAKFVDILYTHEKNCDFIEKKISRLNKNLSFLIYNELMRSCKGDEYLSMKELIFQKFLDKLDNIDTIIDLIDSLGKKDKTLFFEELMKKCQFSKEEFYLFCPDYQLNLL